MLRSMMRAKVHRATVTRCDVDYVGSITIDAELLRAVDIRPNELVHVYDIDNAARFETYVILGAPGSGEIGINGAAARLVNKGDRVIIVAFGLLEESDLDTHVGRVVICDRHNRIEQQLVYPSLIDMPQRV
ncbi:MAG: aspartate 1-decarboxylase [Phycisphaera sp.]|nr:aspartate 1-decarboxylase [Phycisphaera sp.]